MVRRSEYQSELVILSRNLIFLHFEGHVLKVCNYLYFAVSHFMLIVFLILALGQKDTPADEVVKVTFSEYAMYLPYIYARANIEGKSIEVINNDQK